MRRGDGSSQECLVPYASLVNHSPYPHIIQYGQLDTNTSMLCFPLFRPLTKDHQCFLSYGPLPNLKLLLFYGIAIPDNPHDAVPLQLQVQLPGYSTSLSCCSRLCGFSWRVMHTHMQTWKQCFAVLDITKSALICCEVLGRSLRCLF